MPQSRLISSATYIGHFWQPPASAESFGWYLTDIVCRELCCVPVLEIDSTCRTLSPLKVSLALNHQNDIAPWSNF